MQLTTKFALLAVALAYGGATVSALPVGQSSLAVREVKTPAHDSLSTSSGAGLSKAVSGAPITPVTPVTPKQAVAVGSPKQLPKPTVQNGILSHEPATDKSHASHSTDAHKKQGAVLRTEKGIKKKEKGIRNEEKDIRNEEKGIRNEEKGIRNEEKALRDQEAALRKQEAALRKQEGGLRKEEGGLRKEEGGLRKEEAALKTEQAPKDLKSKPARLVKQDGLNDGAIKSKNSEAAPASKNPPPHDAAHPIV
jgi:hypothetical protein